MEIIILWLYIFQLWREYLDSYLICAYIGFTTFLRNYVNYYFINDKDFLNTTANIDVNPK